jgi:TolB protein
VSQGSRASRRPAPTSSSKAGAARSRSTCLRATRAVRGALVLAALAAPLAALPELPRERVAYASRRPVDWQVFLLEAGSPPRQLTADPALSYDPVFSPDGRWVVFCSERSGNPHLYALDLTANGPPVALTQGSFMDAAPAFTPDGRSLVFVSDRDGNADVFAMPFRPLEPGAGVEAHNLTRHAAGDFRPAVSPDGTQVAFSSDRDHREAYPYRAEIYVMDLDGSHPQRLTRSDAMNGSPAWSADGKTLYFYSDRESSKSGSFRLWAMQADGGNPRPLTPADLSAVSPAVLWDGRVAFAVQRPEGSQILSAAEDGSDVRVESAGRPDCRGPAADRKTRRIVCTGKSSIPSPLPVAAPGARSEVRLPDRVLEVQGLYSLFCSISPDGLEVLTSRSADPGELKDSRLVVSRFDGSREREVFRPPPGQEVWATSWARRADRIAFAVGQPFSADDAVVDVWTARSDGSHPRNLTGGTQRNNTFPDLSADGSQIVFRSTRDGRKAIYLMSSDGTRVRRVATDPNDYVATMPSISPGGDMIVFSTYKLYIQALANGRPSGSPRLFQDYFPSVHPRFSPDGKWIAFASRRAWLNDEGPLSNGQSQPYGEIFVAPVDGSSDPVRLTHNKWEDSVPCWGGMPPIASAGSP